jgi:hypothetical protein
MTTFPRRVWLKTGNGWFSREANPRDMAMRSVIAMMLEPGIGAKFKLTPEERRTLDEYNASLKDEAEPLEKALLERALLTRREEAQVLPVCRKHRHTPAKPSWYTKLMNRISPGLIK